MTTDKTIVKFMFLDEFFTRLKKIILSYHQAINCVMRTHDETALHCEIRCPTYYDLRI